MKLFHICLPADDIRFVVDCLKEELSELCLDDDEILIRCTVVSSYRKGQGYISFEMTDAHALLLMQTLFIYSERYAEAGDEHQWTFFDFAVRMFPSLTEKQNRDF